MHRIRSAILFLCAACPAGPALAETLTYHSEYAISALGLPVGKSSFETVISPDGYSIDGTLKARGLAALFQPTTGTVTIAGDIRDNELTATRFGLDYVSGKERQRTEIGFRGGAVVDTMNDPEPKKRADWIALDPAHLRAAIDPLSALLVPADGPEKVCGRTLPVYDGAMRVDVKLTFLRTVKFSTDGYKGDAVTCHATFEPLSGYRGKRKEIAWLRDEGRMDVSFAPIAGTPLYAPVKAVVATPYGPVRVYATRFGASK